MFTESRPTIIDYLVLVYAPKSGLSFFPALLLAQLHLGNKRIAIPEFASQWVRFAQALVVLDENKPLRVLRMDTEALPFDKQGLVEDTALELRLGDAGRGVFSPISNVIEAGDTFTQARLKWSPSKSESAQLRCIFTGGEITPDFKFPA